MSEGCLVWRCFKITQVPAVAFVALCVPSSDFLPGHIHQISPGSCWSQGLCLTANFLGVEATGTSQLCIEFDSGFGRPWKPQGKSLKRHLPKLAKSAANLIPVVITHCYVESEEMSQERKNVRWIPGRELFAWPCSLWPLKCQRLACAVSWAPAGEREHIEMRDCETFGWVKDLIPCAEHFNTLSHHSQEWNGCTDSNLLAT